MKYGLSLALGGLFFSYSLFSCSPPPDVLGSMELPYLKEALNLPDLVKAVKATGKQDPGSIRQKAIKTITYNSFTNYTLTTNEGCKLEVSGSFKPPQHAGQCPQFQGFKIVAGHCPTEDLE